jgi:hypothetical protein
VEYLDHLSATVDNDSGDPRDGEFYDTNGAKQQDRSSSDLILIDKPTGALGSSDAATEIIKAAIADANKRYASQLGNNQVPDEIILTWEFIDYFVKVNHDSDGKVLGPPKILKRLVWLQSETLNNVANAADRKVDEFIVLPTDEQQKADSSKGFTPEELELLSKYRDFQIPHK